jgi:Uma2 family endonuclease
MNIALRKPMSLPEFLAWEERQDVRFEFDGFQPVAMTGGTVAHEAIGNALRGLLRQRLNASPCRVYGPTLKVEVAGRIRYPDAFVACTPAPRGATVIRDPVVVFEVLSPGTSQTDRIAKLREYQETPSILRYVILEQDSIAATVFARHDGDWLARPVIGEDVLDLPEIGVTVKLTDIYADIEMPEPSQDEDA